MDLRSVSSFFVYLQDVRHEIMNQNPGIPTPFKRIPRKAADMWRLLGDAERRWYMEKGAAARVQYIEDRIPWNELYAAIREDAAIREEDQEESVFPVQILRWFAAAPSSPVASAIQFNREQQLTSVLR